MAQKLILCESKVGCDLLECNPLVGFIADGYEVTSVSGYSTRDNRHMSLVLLSEPASDNNNANGGGEEDDGTVTGDATEPTE